MKHIMMVFLCLVIVPLAFAQEICIDQVCSNPAIDTWMDGDCFEDICIMNQGIDQAASCYESLCSEGAFDSGCSSEYCGGNTNDVPVIQPVSIGSDNDPDKISELQAQIGMLSDKIDQLESEVNSGSIDQLGSSIAEIKADLADTKDKIDQLENNLSSPETSRAGLLISIVLLVFSLGAFAVLNRRQIIKIRPLPPEQKAQINSYVNTHLMNGYTYDQIKKNLLNEGWTEDDIKKAMV